MQSILESQSFSIISLTHFLACLNVCNLAPA